MKDTISKDDWEFARFVVATVLFGAGLVSLIVMIGALTIRICIWIMAL